MSFTILQGDCIEEMAKLEEASVDAVVCDPPYGLSREPDIAEVLTHWLAGDDYSHRGGGFMGHSWDSFVPGPAVWREAFRVLKPGGHLLAFAGARTFDLMAIAIRFAGFEIRDSIMWLYGSGFPKSHDVSKAIDKAAGAEREVVGKYRVPADSDAGNAGEVIRSVDADSMFGVTAGRDGTDITAPATPEAAQWEGWGTALKPAHEPIVVARKPLIGTVAENVLEHGTGGINVDGCRVGERPPTIPASGRSAPATSGRWPSNVVLSHLEDCVPVGVKKVKVIGATAHQKHHGKGQIVNPGEGQAEHAGYRDPDGTETVEAWECAPGCPVAALDAQSTEGDVTYGDSGGASRFFYQAKSSRAERNAGLEGFEEKHPQERGSTSRHFEMAGSLSGPRANHHPTVKPINLMRWLVRLVTPPGGTCLDPFLGSGSTGCAAVLEGFDFLGIEREPEYIEIAEARIAFWSQHEAREVGEVLGLHSASERKAKAQADAGQLGLEVA